MESKMKGRCRGKSKWRDWGSSSKKMWWEVEEQVRVEMPYASFLFTLFNLLFICFC